MFQTYVKSRHLHVQVPEAPPTSSAAAPRAPAPVPTVVVRPATEDNIPAARRDVPPSPSLQRAQPQRQTPETTPRANRVTVVTPGTYISAVGILICVQEAIDLDE